MLTQVRRRVTWNNRERRGRVIDSEWPDRSRLCTARETLSPERFRPHVTRGRRRNPSVRILGACTAEEHLRALLGSAPTRDMITNVNYRCGAWCARFSGLPERSTGLPTNDEQQRTLSGGRGSVGS